jgi:hypothetical protein
MQASIKLHLDIVSAAVLSECGRISSITPQNAYDAETYALCEAVKRVMFVRNIISQLYQPVSDASIIYCDNSALTYLTQNIKVSKKIRYTLPRLRFIREAVSLGMVDIGTN